MEFTASWLFFEVTRTPALSELWVYINQNWREVEFDSLEIGSMIDEARSSQNRVSEARKIKIDIEWDEIEDRRKELHPVRNFIGLIPTAWMEDKK